jgi:hypothetical protein
MLFSQYFFTYGNCKYDFCAMNFIWYAILLIK